MGLRLAFAVASGAPLQLTEGMAREHHLSERVQFADTDMAGIVHFAQFFRYMERVEHDFFRSLGCSIWDGNNAVAPEDRVGWPRVHASCDYRSPLRFEDCFTMHLKVVDVSARSIRYEIDFTTSDGRLWSDALSANSREVPPTASIVGAAPLPCCRGG